MKSILCLLATAGLLAGCSKPATPLPPVMAVASPPTNFEYSVKIFKPSPFPDALFEAKHDRFEAELAAQKSEIRLMVKSDEISPAQQDASNLDADATCYYHLGIAEIERDEAVVSNFTAGIRAEVTNGWALVSVVPDHGTNYLLIFKRPVQ